MALVGTREINNVEVEIHADQHGGWSIRQRDEDGGKALGSGTSLDAAVTKARMEIKKQQVKISVPFKTLAGRAGVATGRHARAHDKILTKVGSVSEHMGAYNKVFKADTPKDVIEHLHDIKAEKAKLDKEEREIMTEWSFAIGAAVDKAIKDAAEQA